MRVFHQPHVRFESHAALLAALIVSAVVCCGVLCLGCRCTVAATVLLSGVSWRLSCMVGASQHWQQQTHSRCDMHCWCVLGGGLLSWGY